MKSPFTGKEMKRVYEKRTWNFRGEPFEYVHQAWLCEDSGEQFTSDESDTASYLQVTNQYRAKYGIPFTDEVINVRNRYGISAAKMSQILGIGTNQYRLYEQGEVPNVSNGRMIRSVMNPKVMLEMVESSKNMLNSVEYERIINKVYAIIASTDNYKIEKYNTQRMYTVQRGADNGYAQLSLSRLKNIMLAVLEKCSNVWCTKMNKLLFYIDFLSYREYGSAMTGLTYRAIDYGPVPERWDRIYSEFPEVTQEIRQCGDFEGSVLVANGRVDTSVLSAQELEIIDKVCYALGNMSSRELTQLSHQEQGWIENKEKHDRIAFDYAFELKAI